jgi:hypothetical protein
MIMIFFVSYKTAKLADDVWKQLGITQPDANRNILSSYLEGHFYYSGVKNAKNIVGNNRLAVVKELAAYAKQYTNSAEFKQQYQAYRTKRKPKPAVFPEETAEMIRAQERTRLENDIKTLEANINSPNPKLRNSIPARIEKAKKDLSELDNPDNKTVKMRLDNAARMREGYTKANEAALAKFEAAYPENPQLLIKKRLEELLAATADVDYSAELKEAFGKKVFVNPLYERKSSDWKIAFRAGKETTDAVRSIAQQWIQQIK